MSHNNHAGDNQQYYSSSNALQAHGHQQQAQWMHQQQPHPQPHHQQQLQQHLPQSYGDDLIYPRQFHYQVSQDYRNNMIKELVQIQVYVKEMEEMSELPPQANATQVNLSEENKRKNQETAKQKEHEYLKKAQDQCSQELQDKQHSLQAVSFYQSKLDAIYLVMSKDYISDKKNQVKAYKNEYIRHITMLQAEYDKIGISTLTDHFLPVFRLKRQEYEKKEREGKMTQEDYRKAKERSLQFKKMNDITDILSMSPANLLKHEYLKYRKERLSNELPWFREQSRIYHLQYAPQAAANNQMQMPNLAGGANNPHMHGQNQLVTMSQAQQQLQHQQQMVGKRSHH